jgi:multiple sugar transport system permease protein
MTKTVRNWLDKTFLLVIPLALLVVWVLTPFTWAMFNSVKKEAEIINGISRYLPHTFTFENFVYVWELSNFSVFFRNSLFVACVSVVFILILTLANGYAISRFQFKGKNLFMIVIICTQFIPVIMLLVPQFVMYKSVGLINTHYALIISTVAGAIPFNTLMMKSFISSVPVQIDEAAMVDGASRFRIMLTIIPLIILPGIVAIISFAFIGSWNEFLSAFTFLTSKSKFTISIGLRYMIGEYGVQYAALSAGSIIALIPPLLLFAYVQKYLIGGLNAGAIKG